MKEKIDKLEGSISKFGRFEKTRFLLLKRAGAFFMRKRR